MNEASRVDKSNSMIVSNRYINTRSSEIETRTVVARIVLGRIKINPIIFVNRSPNNISRTTKQLACGGDILFVSKINKDKKTSVFEVYDVLHGCAENNKLPTNKIQPIMAARLLQDLNKAHSDVYKWLDSNFNNYYIPKFSDDKTWDGCMCENDINRLKTVEMCIGEPILNSMLSYKGINQSAWLYSAALFSNGNDLKEMKGYKRNLTAGVPLNVGMGQFVVNELENTTSLCIVILVIKAFTVSMRNERAKFAGVTILTPDLDATGELVNQYFNGDNYKLSMYKNSIKEVDLDYYKNNSYEIFKANYDYLDFTRVVLCLPLEGMQEIYNDKVNIEKDETTLSQSTTKEERNFYKMLTRYSSMPQSKRPYLAVDGWTTRSGT